MYLSFLIPIAILPSQGSSASSLASSLRRLHCLVHSLTCHRRALQQTSGRQTAYNVSHHHAAYQSSTSHQRNLGARSCIFGGHARHGVRCGLNGPYPYHSLLIGGRVIGQGWPHGGMLDVAPLIVVSGLLTSSGFTSPTGDLLTSSGFTSSTCLIGGRGGGLFVVVAIIGVDTTTVDSIRWRSNSSFRVGSCIRHRSLWRLLIFTSTSLSAPPAGATSRPLSASVCLGRRLRSIATTLFAPRSRVF